MPKDTPTQPVEPTDTPAAEENLDPIAAKDVDAFAGNVKGALEANDPEPEEPPDDEDEPEEDDDVETDDEEPEEENEDDAEPAADEDEEAEEEGDQPAPELKEEEDKAGVFQDFTVEDPGEFKSGDYSFEIKLKDGKSYKIGDEEDVNAVTNYIDENPDTITAAELIKFTTGTTRMNMGVAEDRKAWEKKSQEYNSQKELVNHRQQQLNTWEREFQYLEDSDSIPAIDPKYVEAIWEDPKVAKQPGVKERLEIMQWMQKENAKRAKAQLPEMTSFVDAFNTMQFQNLKKENKSADKKDKKERRAKGAMVGSIAPYTPSKTTKGEIVGTGGSLNDLVDF